MREVVTSRDGALQARADQLTSRRQAIWRDAPARSASVGAAWLGGVLSTAAVLMAAGIALIG